MSDDARGLCDNDADPDRDAAQCSVGGLAGHRPVTATELGEQRTSDRLYAGGCDAEQHSTASRGHRHDPDADSRRCAFRADGNPPAPKEPATRASAPRGIWTIQLAAYNTRADAEALVRKLFARGVNARISGVAKPFRVRLDYYDTREDAAARVAELKQRGIIGFVTDEPRSAGASRP